LQIRPKLNIESKHRNIRDSTKMQGQRRFVHESEPIADIPSQ
jgi:hypothetical protein